MRLRGVVVLPREHRQPEQPERQVDPEDRPPAERVDEERPQRRPGERRRAPDGAEESLDAGALLEREDVAEDRQHDRHDAARAEALEAAEDDELRHRLRERREQRREQNSAIAAMTTRFRPNASASRP